MRIFPSIFLVAIIFSACYKSDISNPIILQKKTDTIRERDFQKEMEITMREEGRIMKKLKEMYDQSNDSPVKMVKKANRLIKEVENDKNSYLRPVKSHIISQIKYFKAETLYKSGKYLKSINLLSEEKGKSGKVASAIAANYIKLGEFDLAKSYIDSIGNESIHYYILGNYYESIGNKEEALKVYEYIIHNELHKPYDYYNLCIKRVEDITNTGSLKKETYFPSGKPIFNEPNRNDR